MILWKIDLPAEKIFAEKCLNLKIYERGIEIIYKLYVHFLNVFFYLSFFFMLNTVDIFLFDKVFFI